MQNLDQIRAAKAITVAATTTKQAVAKLPAMILTNGLLAAAAFANEASSPGNYKRSAMHHAMDGVSSHLAHTQHGITRLANVATAQAMIEKLSATGSTSQDLQRATAEALAFLAYVKRFATKEGDEA